METCHITTAVPVVSTATLKDYFALLKPRVMSLVIFTAMVGFAVRPENMHPFLMFVSLLSIAIGAGASGALNMWYDADIDHIMQRTKSRPIPSGRITMETARDFGLVLSLFSVVTLAISSNLLAAFLLAFTIFFYVVVYTMWLKRSTPQNIVIGGLSGALPPLIATAATTGSITLEGVILCAIIFFWTPPHFWALAIVKKQDYKAANIPMLPNIEGDKHTQDYIIYYAIFLFLLSFTLFFLGFADILYLTTVSLLGVYYLYTCFNIRKNFKSSLYIKSAIKSFGVSIMFLFSLFLSLLIEHLTGLNIL